MNKKSGWWLLLAVVAGALVMQGCAHTGGVRGSASTAAATTKIPEYKGKPVIAADTKDHFDAIAAAVRQQMKSGGRFAETLESGKQKVDTTLTDMGTLFAKYGSVAKMTPNAHARLLADQNTVNAILAKNDLNRMICWQETPVGSHFPKTVCRTVGQIRGEKNKARQKMLRTQQIMRSTGHGHL